MACNGNFGLRKVALNIRKIRKVNHYVVLQFSSCSRLSFMTVICLLDAVGTLKQQKQGKLILNGSPLKAVILDTTLQYDPEYHGSHAIRVTNIPPRTSRDKLERFFKISRRSGGGDLEEVFYNSEDDVAVVTFSRADSKLCISLTIRKTP